MYSNTDKDAIHNALIDIRVDSGVAFDALKAEDMRALSRLCDEMRKNLGAIHRAITNIAANKLLDNIITLPFDEAWPAMKQVIAENHTLMFHPRMVKWARDNAKLVALKLKENKNG